MTKPENPIVQKAVEGRADHRLRLVLALLVAGLVLSLIGLGTAVWYAMDQRAEAAKAGVALAERIAQECRKPAPDRDPVVNADGLCKDAKAVVESAPSATLPGPAGPPGPPGADGVDGVDGVDGIDGLNGKPGRDGTDGKNGPPGAPGSNGVDGSPGPAGQDGATGPAGPPGPQGDPGPQGPQGPAGMECPDGYQAQQVTVPTDQGPATLWACVQQTPSAG